MKSKALFVLALFLAVPQAEAAERCSGTSRHSLTVASGEPFDLPLVPVAGALDYHVSRSASWSVVPSDLFLMRGELMSTRLRPAAGSAPRLTDRLFNTDPQLPYAIYYVVTVTSDAQSFQSCWQDFVVSLMPDALLARDSTRIVVPVAGVLRGANNSSFNTRLILENTSSAMIAGTLVFHATGGGATASMRYSLMPRTWHAFDDVATQMGVAGLGSLDVVPDRTEAGYLAPRVTALLESIAPGGGSYGAEIPVARMNDSAFGAVWTSIDKPRFVAHDLITKRQNIGIRTLADEVTLSVIVYGVDGSEKRRFERSYPADYHEQRPLAEFLGDALVAGDAVELLAMRESGLPGGAIVYLAHTDNVTNDVRVEVPRAAEPILRQPIIACSGGEGCRQLERR